MVVDKKLCLENFNSRVTKIPRKNFQIAVRLNPFRTDEYEEDLKMLKQIHQYMMLSF